MYVEMKNIYKKYGDFLASDNVSFGVEKGKLVVSEAGWNRAITLFEGDKM